MKLLLLLPLIAAPVIAQNGAGSYLTIKKQDSSFMLLTAVTAPTTNRFYIQSIFGLDGTNKWGRNDTLPQLNPPQWSTNTRQFNYNTGPRRQFFRLTTNPNATNLIALNEAESVTDTNWVNGTQIEVEDEFVPPQAPTNAP